MYLKVFVLLFIFKLLMISDGFKLLEKKFNTSSLIFPKDFIFSAATSSYQIEGAWNIGGKGENIWDRLAHTNPSAIVNNDTGDIACDSYHKYKEDVQNLKFIGFKMYRFSLSWSRIFPEGFVRKPNPDGVRYYNDLIDELLSNGIEPMITLYHWDLPQPLQDIGGWLNPDIADIFGDYTRAVFELFGHKVKWWITMNEPKYMTSFYGETDTGAPMINLHGIGEYLAGHNLLRAHAKAYRIYDKEFRPSQNGKISFILHYWFMIPKNASDPEDIKAAERGLQFNYGWFGHPIYSKNGDYPAVMRKMVDRNSRTEGRQRSRLPHFTKQEIEDLRGSFDYMAINHYTSKLVTTGLMGQDPSVYKDSEVLESEDDSWPGSACNWLKVVPEGLSGILRWLRKEYDNPEIFITEQGYCGSEFNDDEEMRLQYYESYLNQLVVAINEGSKVLGYTVWSIMDTLEWLEGYTKKFGLISVDFNDSNRTRTFKESAAFFKQIIDQNTYVK